MMGIVARSECSLAGKEEVVEDTDEGENIRYFAYL